MKQLMTGNEAISSGAWEVGVRFASAYPGLSSNLRALEESRNLVWREGAI